MRIPTIRKNVTELGIIPRFYGVAWRDFTFVGSVCYPIPLNIIIRVLHGYWYKLKVPWFKCPQENREAGAYAKGREDGKKWVLDGILKHGKRPMDIYVNMRLSEHPNE